ncbi:hypothetical protein N781_00045 [Pontibacillus halophilus JSM 076056 = DSM 19796]|uniref:YetF C-terminal domain-containing protein n=1 Tax=Pontibacillus halophilus JSM 076056 = DSM 19796 TaxID=1385510 RepID=A0A0A5GNV4_9BACI|nr:YetF domain-containing protein [Pontibacillus halophilus]KGX93649.1 hypothetical protein N781_00045 [Pontibacillus halophilus JSM 076056 = DSM 19796]
MNVVFESLLMVASGIFLLRLAGRKSISQMSLSQTVIMISIGSIIIQPIIETSIRKTLLAAMVFIVVLVLTELLQIKVNIIEKWITGKARIVIQDGIIQVDELKKLRMSVDQLEMFLRQQGITSIEKVKTATMEANGQLGYELAPTEKPVTIGDLQQLLHPSLLKQSPQSQQNPSPLFQEIRNAKGK